MIAPLSRIDRAWKTTFGVGFAAAPRLMTSCIVYNTFASVMIASLPIGFKEMTNAAIHHNRGQMVIGVLLVVLLFSGSWLINALTGEMGGSLVEHVQAFSGARTASIIGSVVGIEHLERPEYLERIELIKKNRQPLINAPNRAIFMLQVVVRSVTIGIILGGVYGPLVLLLVLAIPAIIGDIRSGHIKEIADRATSERRRLASELFTLASTSAPAKELRVFGLRDELLRRYNDMTRDVRRICERANLRATAWSATGWALFGTGFVASMILVINRAVHGQSSAGDVVMTLALLRSAQSQIAMFSGSLSGLAETSRVTANVLWLEEYASEHQAEHQAKPLAAKLHSGIDFEHVNFNYPGTDAVVLDDLTFHLPAGSVVALVGNNGAGKTTLVKLLTAMYRPTSGTIRIDGTELDDIDPREWRSRSSAAYQDFARYELTAGQGVGVGDLARIDDTAQIQIALERAAASDIVDSLADGLDTTIGRTMNGVRDLSGGQWQKLALGRAMMRDQPVLLVLDEPTASLDAATEGALFEKYVEGAKRLRSATGAITLLVSHRFSTVRMADLIVVIDHGQITEFGSHAELMAFRGTYAELYELQARSYR